MNGVVGSFMSEEEEVKVEEEKMEEVEEEKVEERVVEPAPRKPVTAYVLFSNEYRAQAREENPDASFADLGRIVGEAWKRLPGEVRAQYMNRAHASMDQWRVENEQWKMRNDPDYSKREITLRRDIRSRSTAPGGTALPAGSSAAMESLTRAHSPLPGPFVAQAAERHPEWARAGQARPEDSLLLPSMSKYVPDLHARMAFRRSLFSEPEFDDLVQRVREPRPHVDFPARDLFYEDIRPALKRARPNASYADISEALRAEWDSLPARSKRVYFAAANVIQNGE